MANPNVEKIAPILFCFCAPAASGKTTITRELIKSDPSLHLSISTTTRQPRPGEVHGREYFFVTREEFQEKIQRGEFLEHAAFADNFYGTGNENMDRAHAQGADLILDIDVQGAEQVRKLFPSRVVVVFVFPPSMEILRERLRSRGTEDEAKMQKRLNEATREIEKLSSPGFSDYLLINDELPQAIQKAREIVSTERLRCSRLNFKALFN